MIDTEKDTRKIVERALIIGLQDASCTAQEAEEHLIELKELVKNLSIPIVDKLMVHLKKPNPKYLVGTGKAEEITQLAKEKNCDCLFFDCDLSPSQQRNWEKLTKICVIDRQEVIIDIFASRASTKEAVLQVELARLKYSMPRLTRAWTHLSRQYGGITGARGEGEKQIELDRQIIKHKISQLEKELLDVRKHRDIQRKNRERHGLSHAAILGYTNAGKSSLLNALTSSNALVENKLFATLDPLTRKAELPDNQNLLLTDTVGFVRKLPHNLVEAFKATLEEATLADFLLIVLDLGSSQIEEHWETTLSVLKELGADDKRKILVFNKCDLNKDPVLMARLQGIEGEKLFVSALTGEGIGQLKSRLSEIVKEQSEKLSLRIPPARHDMASFAYEKGNVIKSEYDENGDLLLTVNVNMAHRKKFDEFVI